MSSVRPYPHCPPQLAVLRGLQGEGQSLWSQCCRTQHGRQAHTSGSHGQTGQEAGRGDRGALDGAVTVQAVVGLVVRYTVLFVEQVGRLVRQPIVQLRKSQFNLSVFTVRRLRGFVHPGCHQGILVLLSGDLGPEEDTENKPRQHLFLGSLVSYTASLSEHPRALGENRP